VETGEVWIAARSGVNWGDTGHVEKLQMDASGNYSSVAKIPSTEFSGLVRGLSIQRNGDIWVADCTSDNRTASIKRFSASDLKLNKTIGADGSFYCPYGLSIDSADNIWMNDNGGGGMKKINPETGQIFTYANAGIYGITVDNNDNAWGGGYTDYGIKKIPFGQNSGTPIHYTGFPYWQTYMTGVTLDKDGNIWSGGYTPNYKTYKFDQNGVLQPGFPVPSGGVNPHGIFGTSDGYVWQSHISSNIIRVFNSAGGVVADFKGGNIAGGIYTYSDATGLNRAMVMRSGLWVSNAVDSKIFNQHWGTISWEQSAQSSKQSIEVYARADNNIDNLKNRIWVRAYQTNDPENKDNTWNAVDISNDLKVGRYIQFKVLLRSTERGVTPVVWDLQVK
jgi:streptogramin lyase